MQELLRSISNQQDPSNPPEKPDSIDNFYNYNNNNDGQSKWNSDDLDFFDSMYDDKFVKNETAIEHIEKETYFRDVHLFVERTRDIAMIKNVEMIRENLWMSLRDIALK